MAKRHYDWSNGPAKLEPHSLTKHQVLVDYLNRIPSSRRLERECQRNVELMWLTGRLAPDFKTIADFRRDSGTAIRNTCRRFAELRRGLKLLSSDMVAIDGSKFKASNSRDLNYTTGKLDDKGIPTGAHDFRLCQVFHEYVNRNVTIKIILLALIAAFSASLAEKGLSTAAKSPPYPR